MQQHKDDDFWKMIINSSIAVAPKREGTPVQDGDVIVDRLGHAHLGFGSVEAQLSSKRDQTPVGGRALTLPGSSSPSHHQYPPVIQLWKILENDPAGDDLHGFNDKH